MRNRYATAEGHDDPCNVASGSRESQGMPFLAASAAFVVDIIVSVVVSLVTAPKPEAELTGLVYSQTR